MRAGSRFEAALAITVFGQGEAIPRSSRFNAAPQDGGDDGRRFTVDRQHPARYAGTGVPPSRRSTWTLISPMCPTAKSATADIGSTASPTAFSTAILRSKRYAGRRPTRTASRVGGRAPIASRWSPLRSSPASDKDFLRCDDVQILAVGRYSRTPIVAAGWHRRAHGEPDTVLFRIAGDSSRGERGGFIRPRGLRASI